MGWWGSNECELSTGHRCVAVEEKGKGSTRKVEEDIFSRRVWVPTTSFYSIPIGWKIGKFMCGDNLVAGKKFSCDFSMISVNKISNSRKVTSHLKISHGAKAQIYFQGKHDAIGTENKYHCLLADPLDIGIGISKTSEDANKKSLRRLFRQLPSDAKAVNKIYKVWSFGHGPLPQSRPAPTLLRAPPPRILFSCACSTWPWWLYATARCLWISMQPPATAGWVGCYVLVNS
jgi:hypothetical protein